MVKKSLIIEAHVLAAWADGRRTLTLVPGTIVTPLARDTARTKGVALVTATPGEPATPSPGVPGRIVALGSDHGGYGYKEQLKPVLNEVGWQVLDVGTDSEQSCDYPDFAFAVARAVALGQARFGVMIDGAGLGSAMVCNKVPGVRAACCYNTFTAWNARAHNDANVLTLGSRTLGIEVCKRILHTFLDTPFEGGRHQRRVGKIADVEARFLPVKTR